MALSPCRECGADVSAQARVCPLCGAPFPARQDWNGTGFDWKSEATFYGYPLVHVAFGRDKSGKRRVAKGVIASGQYAVGLITVAQFGVGVLFGFGQFILGFTAVAQFAGGCLFGLGQIAVGYVAIGQFAVGYYALCQLGVAEYIWSTTQQDPQAVNFFRPFVEWIKQLAR